MTVMKTDSDERSAVLQLAAPVIAIGATMLVRRVLDSGYRRFTGSSAPDLHDTRSGLTRVVLWAAITAVIAAEVEVAVYRFADRPRRAR